MNICLIRNPQTPKYRSRKIDGEKTRPRQVSEIQRELVRSGPFRATDFPVFKPAFRKGLLPGIRSRLA